MERSRDEAGLESVVEAAAELDRELERPEMMEDGGVVLHGVAGAED